LLTVGWLTASFWPLFYARVAWRAISLPFVAALSAYFLLRAADLSLGRFGHSEAYQSNHSRLATWALAGGFLGLSLYTYMSARVLPAILVILLVHLSLTRFRTRLNWSGVVTFFLVAAVVSAPLAVWLATHPGAEHRFLEVREPIDRLFAGDPSLVWQNLVANLKFFACTGDPWKHQNFDGRPIFADPVGAVLFCAGVPIALYRWRDPRYSFLLIWTLGALVPSILTAVAPSSVRDILGLVTVFVFPSLAVVQIGRWTKRFWSRVPRFLVCAGCALLFIPNLLLTVQDYFVYWPRDEVARFFFQVDLTTVGCRLDDLPEGAAAAVAGLTVHTTDGGTLAVSARRDVRDVRLCDTRETLVVPGGRDVWLFVPQVVPFDPDLLERFLGSGGMEVESQPSFTSYHLSNGDALRYNLFRLQEAAALPDGSNVTLPVSFGGRLALEKYEWLQQSLLSGESLTLLTYWRVEDPSPTTLKTFIHLVGGTDAPIAQHDGLASPPHGWATGDLVIQKHVIPLPVDLAADHYHLYIGVYDAVANVRLPVLEGDRLLLHSFEAIE
jgi:hypothetical protein